jgi:hypothetical protein
LSGPSGQCRMALCGFACFLSPLVPFLIVPVVSAAGPPALWLGGVGSLCVFMVPYSVSFCK